MRARVLLIRAITEGTAARDLARFFDKSVAEQIRGSEHEVTAGQGQAREAAVLFVDIRGFTVLGTQLPPDELIGVLAEYQHRMVPLMQQHNGTIDKFMGDGIMATFGATMPTETYAADVLKAIDALIADVDAWSTERWAANRPPIRVGMAAAAGHLVFGAVGEAERLEYTVIGEPVNLTARLEKHTKEEKVRALTTCATYQLAVQQGYERKEEPEVRTGRQLYGLAEPLDLAVLA